MKSSVRTSAWPARVRAMEGRSPRRAGRPGMTDAARRTRASLFGEVEIVEAGAARKPALTRPVSGPTGDGQAPGWSPPKVPLRGNVLKRWDITMEELTSLVNRSAGLRGIMLGYVAELQLVKQLLRSSPLVQDVGKPNDYQRGAKGNHIISFRGCPITVRGKSLQSGYLRKRIDPKTGQQILLGRAALEAGHRRTLTLPDGSILQTTCLPRGAFDLVAINCYMFEQTWRFIYARTVDLPSSNFSWYTAYQRRQLLASSVLVSWPPEPPFYADPVPLLEAIVRDRRER